MKFLNGFCCDARHLTRLADGVVFGSLAAAAREYPGLVGKYYNTLPHGRGSAVAELTAAFVQDGAFVYVPRGIRVELPFAVECGLYGDGEAVASFGRNLFIFEEGSQAQLVIDYRTLSGERNLACRTREIFVGSGARVEMVESCRLNERSSLISASYARQQGDSVLHGVSVGLSAGLMRNEQTVLLEGRGAKTTPTGLRLPESRSIWILLRISNTSHRIVPATSFSKDWPPTAGRVSSAGESMWRRMRSARRRSSRTTTCC